MRTAAAASPSTNEFLLESPNLGLRPLTVDDVSDRFVSWFAQDEIRSPLNLPSANRTKAEMIAYVQSFDQDARLLLGIFDKANGLLVGFFSVQIERRIGRYLVNTVVGEPAYRTKGLMLEITLPFREYFFETLGLKVMTATALATNAAIIGYLEKTGWTRNQTLKGHSKSQVDGAMIDLHLYSITREAWQAWKGAHPDIVEAMAKGLLRTART
jgi:RimJ/RimL family protein N-acetyltransferase